MSDRPPSKSANLYAPKGRMLVRDGVWRRPHSGLLAQGMRFALTGCLVSAVYLLTTSVLALVIGLPFQVALAIGFTVAVGMHFSLQRLFVWTDHDGFALAFPNQVGRYLLAAGTQYGVTALSTLLLPPMLGLPTEPVYLMTSLLVASANFVLFRNYIFHGRPVIQGSHAGPAEDRAQASIVDSTECGEVGLVS